METVRVDRWLWAVRLFKTRSAATDACRAGHVRVNGAPAKPSTPVRAGDRITTKGQRQERDVEVVRLVDKRVGASIAADCLVDHTPPPPPRDHQDRAFARPRGAGRPTKRERRQLDQFRRR